ncbi:hypothetical protein D3C75_945120 [compost metagenome]
MEFKPLLVQRKAVCQRTTVVYRDLALLLLSKVVRFTVTGQSLGMHIGLRIVLDQVGKCRDDASGRISCVLQVTPPSLLTASGVVSPWRSCNLYVGTFPLNRMPSNGHYQI